MRIWSTTLAIMVVSMLTSHACAAGVTGRYIFYGNALSEPMQLREIEVFSGGRNVLAGRPEAITRGLEAGTYRFDRTPEQIAQFAKTLVDGNVSGRVDLASRLSLGGGVPLCYASIEVDLGKSIPIERIVIDQGKGGGAASGDLGWRLVAVLDANRRVVAWKAYNTKDSGAGVIDIAPTRGGLTGRHVEPSQACWFTEVEYLHEGLGKPLPAGAKWTEVGSVKLPEVKYDAHEIRELGERFFKIAVDLDHPSMAKVKPLAEQQRYAEAFEAFKRPMFELLAPMAEWDGGMLTDSYYAMYGWPGSGDSLMALRAKDLRNGVQANLKTLTIERVTPGQMPVAGLSWPFPNRPLLVDYAYSRNRFSLALWEQMANDWANRYQAAADKNPQGLRNLFVLGVGDIGRLMRDFYLAAQANPKLIDEMSGVTLARLLMPILEELPVSAWRVNRKAVLNHTFNSIPMSLFLAKFMPEFRAIQRLERDSAQGFTKLSTLTTYRDGPMVEMGDEGHFAAPVGQAMNVYGILMHWGTPDWLTPARQKYFVDQHRQSVLISIRHISQTGANWRWNRNIDYLNHIEYMMGVKDLGWSNLAYGTRMTWGETYPKVAAKISDEPQPRAIIDTVYGRGRTSYPNSRKNYERKVVAQKYDGKYEGKPSFDSDFLPYAGLWYFRSGWDRDDAYLHMMSPPIVNSHYTPWYIQGNSLGGNPEILVPTSYIFVDYASLLMSSLGVFVDDLPPAPWEGRYPTGSKQDVFAQAAEQPQSLRWYSGPTFDFGEARYTGNYRSASRSRDPKTRDFTVELSNEVVKNTTATRQIFQVRPGRLFLQVDRVKYADPAESHVNSVTNIVRLIEPGNGKPFSEQQQLDVSDRNKTIRTSCPDNAGLTVQLFGQPAASVEYKSASRGGGPRGSTITYNSYKASASRDVVTTWRATGQSVLISAFRGNKPGQTPIKSTKDISNDSYAGAEIVTEGSMKSTLLVARQIPAKLSVGRISVNGEALLVVEETGKEPCGIVLGAVGATIAGSKPDGSAADYQFDLNGGKLAATAIHRPIDAPKILPMVNTFIDKTEVTITSATPADEIDIYYTTDGSDPTTESTFYTGPFVIDRDTFVQARAFRKGVTEIPFLINGTQVSLISYGEFTKQAPMPAMADKPANLTAGLNYDYMEDRWFALWTYTNELPAKSSGKVDTLLDVSMRKTDGPFAVRYNGYIEIPATGVYTFYGPHEFVNNICEPGYDLRVYIDGKQWDLGQMWHGRGMWSVPLAKGTHQFVVTFADARAKDIERQRVDLWNVSGGWGYPKPATTWRGVTPKIELSGPQLERQPLPNGWLHRGS